jgi:SAM-dependent methyltransferase
MASIDHRGCETEIMDDPGLDAAEHFRALEGLSRLNWASRSARLVWQPIHALSRDRRGDRLRVLDIGSGAGDVLLGLWKRASRYRLQLDLHGVDISKRAVAYARARCRSAGARIRFTQLDALEEPLPEGYDVLISSLFCHHLSEGQVVSLLARMAAATKQMVLVSDLRRCSAGLVLAHVACRLLTRSPVVHADGPSSVRAAFTLAEMRVLAQRAGLGDARVAHRWPYRLLCTWRKGA